MPLSEIKRYVDTVVRALPARLAAAASVLTVISVQVVPLLPGPAAAKVAAWCAAGLVGIAYVTRAVARLAPVIDEAMGVLLPEGQRLHQELVGHAWPAGYQPDSHRSNDPRRG